MQKTVGLVRRVSRSKTSFGTLNPSNPESNSILQYQLGSWRPTHPQWKDAAKKQTKHYGSYPNVMCTSSLFLR